MVTLITLTSFLGVAGTRAEKSATPFYKNKISEVLADVYSWMFGGFESAILTLRDLSTELSELGRFITVKSDENII